MKIIKPSVQLLEQEDTIRHIATCARICYASTSSNDESKFVEALWKNKHRSMFRHAGAYYIIPCKLDIPYKAFSYINAVMKNGLWYISTNEQTAREYMKKFEKYRISVDEAKQIKVFVKNKLIYYTFILETGIDITRELNRKSPNAIAEQSTRYVDFDKKLGIRFKKCHWMDKINLWQKFLVKLMSKTDEWFYKISRSKYGLNLKPQDARWCLFLDLISEVAYTYTVKDWEHIINLRLFDYTGPAHPDAKVVVEDICMNLRILGYNIEKYKK